MSGLERSSSFSSLAELADPNGDTPLTSGVFPLDCYATDSDLALIRPADGL